jgi:hypothetical protein
MARIRTIKPEFFTSEDIVSLSPMARILYIALWCEADKEGRMVWKPKTFKMRYLPADSVKITDLCDELVNSGLIVLYGDCYAFIPSFKSHQHVNPRETPSQLPEPDSDASTTRQPRVNHASERDSDAQGGREGKGKINTRQRRSTSKTPISENFAISERVKNWAEKNSVGNLLAHFENFVSASKAKGYTYADWDEALMNAIRNDWAKIGKGNTVKKYAEGSEGLAL